MERIKVQTSFGRIFARYIMYFCSGTIFLVIMAMLLFTAVTESGIVLPANYYEKSIEQNREAIAEAEEVKALIPETCMYAVYNLEGRMLQGNISEKKSLDIWNMLKNKERINGNYFYKIIKRKNEICVVEYKLKPQYTNPFLRKYFPSIESIFVVLCVILFICEVIIFSKYFRKRMLKEMKILKDTTENIQMENLDFQIKYSNILEINDVLSALSKMKTELQQSLNKQWKMEESRKEQMAALAHDIKTPLTILRGNAELLNELDSCSEQSTFIKNILNESAKMESYIKSLIEIMKSERESVLHKKQIKVQNFIQDIVEIGASMIMDKGLKFINKIEEIPEFFLVDEEALQRAIINVISNAVDYSPESGEILFYVDTNNDNIRFVVEDSGRGFTQEELKYAAEQFFQGNKSRNSSNHYGMGLYIAKEFMRQHNGTISLENSKKLGGAKVTLEIPGIIGTVNKH